MPSSHHSYIEITALDAIRARFAAGDAMVVLTPALDQVIWANGAGAALLGYADAAAIIGAQPQLGLAAKRQVMATSGYPRIGKDRAITVRLASGLMSRAVSFAASEIALPGGVDAILLAAAAPAASWRNPAETAARAIAGLDRAGEHVAIVDAAGKPVATSRKFDALGIGSEVLALLIAETRSERLMKRPIETARGPRAAGFLRLSDDPAMHLLVVADEALPAAEPVAVSTDAAELPVPAAMDESPAPAAAAAAEVGEADAEQPSVDSGQTMPGQASEADPARQVAELQAPADVTSQEALDQAAARTNGVGQEQPAEAREEQPPTAEERQPPADTPLQASAEPQLGWEAAAPQPAEAAVAEAPAEIATVGAGAADLPGDRATEAETLVAEAVQPAEAAGEQVASNASEDVQRSVASDQESAQPVAEPEAGPLPEEPTEPVAASEAEREAVESATADEPEGEEAQASTNVAVGDATDGTSAEDSPMDAGPVASAASDLASSEPVAASIPPIEVDRSAAPVRFVWKTDAAGRFSEIGSEFVTAVGGPAANVMGLSFREAAARLGIDPSGEIAGLLERHDTWSGRAVFWPVAGTDLRIPVDLAALPTYDRDRKFAGFRGFGVARAADAVVDPEATGLALLGNQPAPATVEEPAVTGEPTPTSPGAEQSASGGVPAAVADPFQGEPRILTIVPKPDRRQADKVIRLAEHRQPTIDKNLSPGERNAFREIGDRLRKDNGAPVARTPAEPTLRADNDRASPAEKTSSQPPARGGGSPDADSEEPRPASPPDTGDFQREDAAALEAVFADPMLAGGETSEGEAVAEQGDVAPAAPTEIPADDVSAGTAFAEPASGGETAPADARRDATVEADAGGHDAAAGVGEAAKPDAAPAGTTATDDGAQASVTVQEDGVGLASEQSPEEAAATLEPEAGAAEVQSQGANPQLAADIAEAAPIEAGEAADAMVARADEPQPVAEQAPPAEAAAPQQDFLPSAFAFDAPSSGRVAVDTSILEKLPVPVLIHAGDELHYANREFFELTGFNSVAELQAAGGLDALFGDPYPAEEGDDEHGRKLRLRTSEGLEYPVEAFLQSVPWGEGKSLLLSLRRSWRQPVSYPVAAPVMATDPDLEARIAEMRAIVDTATDGVVLIAPDGTIRSISSPAEALFAFDSAEVAGKPFTSLFAIESQRAARDYLNGLSDNGVASVLNDGREVIGREAQGRFIPLFMTIGKLPNDSGFCAVVRDITQWKRAEEELTQARAQAERASSQKTDFLARVSHEIRTPLNAIIGFSELMLDEKFGPVGNDRYRDYLRDINRSGNHVLDLVNDLLDISKIEAGQQEMSYEAVSLNDTLGETVAMMQPAANRERVIIRSSFASRLPEVVADLRSVRQIALNLLSNAIRYTPAGGQVIVSTAYESSGDVVMRVRDTGIGMSQAEIEQALKPFKQINALKRARGDGTGLGLPLTKAMVEANRARFTINSTPGEGTLVEVSFPSTRVLAD